MYQSPEYGMVVYARVHRVLSMSEYTSVPEYVSMSINAPQYSWKRLNKLFWLCHQSFQSTSSSHIFDSFEYASVIKYDRVLNMLRSNYNSIIIVTNV